MRIILPREDLHREVFAGRFLSPKNLNRKKRLVGAFEVLKIGRNGYLEIGGGSGHILAIIGEKRIYIYGEK